MSGLERVVAGYDGSDRGRDGLVLAELLARTGGGELLVVRVDKGLREGEHREATEGLSAELDVALAASSVRRGLRVVDGDSPARALHELARGDPRIDLIALGSTHRAGLGRVMPGATADRLLAGAPCSVAVAPRGYSGDGSPAAGGGALGLAEALRVIEVGFDASVEAEAALELATNIAIAAEATLRVIAVGYAVGATAEPVDASAQVPETDRADLQSRLHDVVAVLPRELRALPLYERGEPARLLLERAEEGVDLIVMGSRGYGPLRSALLGSTSALVSGRAPCPVLVCPRPAIDSRRGRGRSSPPDSSRRSNP